MNTFQSVNSTGGTPSRPLLLTVVKAETPHPSLPTPYIEEASGGELDLIGFAGDAHVAVARWPLIAAGQRVWLQIAGTGADGTTRTIELLTAYSLTASDAEVGLNRVAQRADLSAFKDGSPITVEFSVGFDQSGDRSKAVVFQTVSYTIRHALPLYIDPSEVRLDVGESITRAASGGAPPYKYTSSNSAVASVDQASGTVTALAVGAATITVADIFSGRGIYPVFCEKAALDFENFESAAQGKYTGDLVLPGLTVNGGAGEFFSIVRSWGGTTTGNNLYATDGVNYNYNVRLDLRRERTGIRFGTVSQGANGAVAFLDAQGAPVGHLALPPGINRWIEFSAPAGKCFRYVQFIDAAVSVDNVTMS